MIKSYFNRITLPLMLKTEEVRTERVNNRDISVIQVRDDGGFYQGDSNRDSKKQSYFKHILSARADITYW